MIAHEWRYTDSNNQVVSKYSGDGSFSETIQYEGNTYELTGTWKTEDSTFFVKSNQVLTENGFDEGTYSESYTYAYYMTDDIINQGKQAIDEALSKYGSGDQWYVSDKYLYFDGSVYTAQ